VPLLILKFLMKGEPKCEAEGGYERNHLFLYIIKGERDQGKLEFMSTEGTAFGENQGF